MSVNKYAGLCAKCGREVAARAGSLRKQGSKWLVEHNDCDNIVDDAPVAAAVQQFEPTSEQRAALDLFASGKSMVIEAGAGTGKTATLKLLAESTTRRGQYLAFNRAIVDEASSKFPRSVACNTAHSLAFRAIGKEYSHRLNAGRMTSDTIALMLHVNPITVRIDNTQPPRTLSAAFLASHVMRAVDSYCSSADEAIERRHFAYIDGIDMPTHDGRRTFANNDDIANALLPVARRAWDDLSDKQGQLRFNHGHYLKLWQLSGPRIAADYILFDEAQDANPVMAAIVAAQTHAQVVYVGDSQQAIYEFTGAVNTLAQLDTSHRVFLTQSFRFGEAVADVANEVLDMLDAELRLVGTKSIPSTVGMIEHENAILTRTNAEAVSTVLALQAAGRRPYLVGGGADVVSFAKAARDLMEGGSTSHPELACFSTWGAVQTYVDMDAQGSDLKLLVRLVDKFTVPTILAALDNMPTERAADVVVSTAHKAKGREWDRVRIGGDFPVGDDTPPSTSELRLLYVAVTRARLQLDISSIVELFDVREPAEGVVIDNEAMRWVDGADGEAVR